MIITIPWLKEHLQTKASENKIIDQLTNIGLEVEGIKENSDELGDFKVAKILHVEKHANADKLKVCDVTLGNNKIIKVVCGASNAIEGLITVYAPPGAVIPKNNVVNSELKIHGETLEYLDHKIFNTHIKRDELENNKYASMNLIRYQDSN